RVGRARAQALLRLSAVDVRPVVARVREFIDRRMDELVAPGVQVALTDRERTLAVICRGVANADALIPVEPSHRFQIGSIGKGMTVMALLQEREAGRLDLDAPVTEYLPWLEIVSPYPPITVHHLLSHTSGLIQGMDFTTEAAHEVWSLRELEPGFAPGERFWYSNVGYKALGLVLERLTGRPWFETVHERVMTAVGMQDSSPVITHDVRASLAVGYGAAFDDRPWQPTHGVAPAPWLESGTADGTICATADELAGYVRLLLNEGRGVVEPTSFSLMSSPMVVDEDSGERYGYGLRWTEGRLLGHSGSTVGYAAHASCDPATGFGVAICTNGFGPRISLATFALDTLAAAAGGGSLPEVPPLPDPWSVTGPARYAGVFRGPAGSLEIAPAVYRLMAGFDGRWAQLRPFDPDDPGCFLIEDRDLDRFVLRFEMGEDGRAEIAHHGPDRYEVGGRSKGGPPSQAGAEWGAVVGHYRSHDPWASHIRVFLRDGEPWLQDPAHDEVRYHERPLRALPDGSFRVGEPWSPDRIRFETVIDGRATKAVYDCAPMYRTFTP
ncbi:MAG: serine hydrolase domain-containing protein, partial [Actinomycetota bacterium]